MKIFYVLVEEIIKVFILLKYQIIELLKLLLELKLFFLLINALMDYFYVLLKMKIMLIV
jgi:hypothetical protein